MEFRPFAAGNGMFLILQYGDYVALLIDDWETDQLIGTYEDIHRALTQQPDDTTNSDWAKLHRFIIQSITRQQNKYKPLKSKTL